MVIMTHPQRKEFSTTDEYIELCRQSQRAGIKMPADLASGMYMAGRAK